MNVLNALKGLFKGKGGTDVDDFNITDSAVSSTMRSATSLWWDAFQGQLPFAQTHKNFKPLPVAYTSTAYLAQLVTGEIKFEIADDELNRHVQKNLLPNLDRIVQQTLVGGYTVIKPYFVQSGEMFFDSGTSRDFLPLALDENGHITEGVFFERIRYHGKSTSAGSTTYSGTACIPSGTRRTSTAQSTPWNLRPCRSGLCFFRRGRFPRLSR